MFGRDKGSKFSTHSGSTTLIAAGTEIHGDIQFAGNLEIEGKVIGNINAENGSNAVVRVLEHGEVDGNVKVPTVIVNGTVKGDVHSSSHLDLAAKAKITGDVYYSVIEMAKGARVNGSLVVSEVKGAEVTELKSKMDDKSKSDDQKKA